MSWWRDNILLLRSLQICAQSHNWLETTISGQNIFSGNKLLEFVFKFQTFLYTALHSWQFIEMPISRPFPFAISFHTFYFPVKLNTLTTKNWNWLSSQWNSFQGRIKFESFTNSPIFIFIHALLYYLFLLCKTIINIFL